MRKMMVNVSPGLDVTCNPSTMHVRGHTYEEIAVILHKDDVDYYDLDVHIDEDRTEAVRVDKLSSSVSLLQDDNREPGEVKFSITLTPWIPGSGDQLELDPRIVNE